MSSHALQAAAKEPPSGVAGVAMGASHFQRAGVAIMPKIELMIAHMIAPRFAAAASVPKSTVFRTRSFWREPNAAVVGFLSPRFRRVFGTGSSGLLKTPRCVSATCMRRRTPLQRRLDRNCGQLRLLVGAEYKDYLWGLYGRVRDENISDNCGLGLIADCISSILEGRAERRVRKLHQSDWADNSVSMLGQKPGQDPAENCHQPPRT